MASNRNKSVIFRGARIRDFTALRKKESAPFIRLKIVCDLSSNVRSTMGWSIGDGQKSGSFAGSINATHLLFTANQKKLEGMGEHSGECQIDAHEVSDFSFVERVDKDGTAKGTDLYFTVRTNDPNAAALLYAYIAAVPADSQLKVGYTSVGVKPAETDDDSEEAEG